MTLKPVLKSMLLASAFVSAVSVNGENPKWLEPDSAYAISYRINRDFPHSLDKAKELFPNLTDKQIKDFIKKGYIETLMVDGERKIHKKAPGNYKLLAPEYSEFKGRGATASEKRRKYVEDVLSASKGDGTPSNKQRVKFKFTIDVPTVDAIKGDTLSVWMPLPVVTQRQPRVEVLSATPSTYVISTPARSEHNTVFFRQPVGEKNTHFEYVGEFDVTAQYFSPEYILANMKPYDKESDLYKRYTAFEAPHMVDLSPLAKKIVGKETNPFKCSELVYDYIIKNFPWAGAREYSTIPCIPEYVIRTKHGDCGQVALLYISLMRSLGIPARWESGWMLHPGEKNLHDWAEVYFEGIGWVPIDASFGRYTTSDNPAVVNFYSTGMDNWRFVTNKNVGKDFYPKKKFLRSESVDSQMGEVETTKGNLFYPGWDMSLQIISIEPID